MSLLSGFTSHLSNSNIPQSQPLDNRQVKNNAGGFVYAITDMQRLVRLICLGTEKGSYYVGEKELSLESAASVVRLLKSGQGVQVVEKVASYSVEGRTAKQDNIVFILALCARLGDEETKKAAYSVLNHVCRIPTTLFAFIDACEKISKSSTSTTGWGRAHKKAIANWYLTKSSKDLAYLVTKYKNRNGWTHVDTLRLSHPKSDPNSALHVIFKYIIKGFEEVCKETHHNEPSAMVVDPTTNTTTNDNSNDNSNSNSNSNSSAAQTAQEVAAVLDFLSGVDEMRVLGNNYKAAEEKLKNKDKTNDDTAAAASIAPVDAAAVRKELNELTANAISLIRRHSLAREHLPTEMLSISTIWETLLETMPMTAMIRNLGKMSSLGLFSENASSPAHLNTVIKALGNKEQLRRARVHPLHILTALKTYQAGQGDKGSLTWPVNKTIENALDNAFYLAFKCVQPTGKRFLLGIDVSGSMGGAHINGMSNLTARDGAAAMAMVTLRTEPYCKTMAFCDQFVSLNINADMTLAQVEGAMSRLPFGSTDCAQPMIYALENKIPVDTFIVYTDNETWCGRVHPSKALNNYRLEMNIDAKLIVVAFSVSNFSIADPNDNGMLDMPGFDASAPEVMRSFILGEL